MYTLGINAAFHDPAACLVKDGEVVAAAEEERFTHVKHGKRPVPFSAYELPFHAIHYCLEQAGVNLSEIDHVAYSYDPYLQLGKHTGSEQIALPMEPSAHPTPEEWESKWDPLFLSYIVNAPRQLADGAPFHIERRFRNVRENGHYRYNWHFVEHHLAHAVSAFYPSPYEEAAVLTIDGRGERATTTYWRGEGTRMEPLGQVEMPHSLGMVYEKLTEHLGFLHSSDEFKVMALASYGEPRYLEEFREIIRLGSEGQFTVRQPLDLEARFGPPREKGQPLEQRHFDIAHSLQAVLEETVLEITRWLHEKTGSKNLCMAGGVALNCVMNTRIRDEGPFENIWIQPAAGDSGTALGAALWIDARERNAQERPYRMEHVFLGPGYSEQELKEFLDWSHIPYRKPEDISAATAELLAEDKVIAWYQSNMEFGPRALGSRSILASPISPEMKDTLNDIKGRENFRPVAPVVLQEEAPNWFVNAGYSPYMLFVFDVQPDKAGRIPAVTHIDNTARIQTINRDQHPAYYDLVKAFQERTGVPVLVNTSFNTRGEPIVCTPRDAVESFWSSPLDALVIGPFIVEKEPARK